MKAEEMKIDATTIIFFDDYVSKEAIKTFELIVRETIEKNYENF